jgi:hypothetical protein
MGVCMALIRDFSNPSHWIQLWGQTFSVPNPLDTHPTPIGEIGIPLLLEDWTIAIKSSSSSAKATWHYAGLAKPGVFTSINAFTEGDAHYTPASKLYLNTLVILEIPQVSTYYTLRITVPQYFKDVTYQLFAYTGPTGDTLTKAVTESIQPNVISIARKVGASFQQ